MTKTPIPIEIKTVSEWSKPILPFLNNFNKKLYEQLGLFENDPLPEIAPIFCKDTSDPAGKKLENERD